MTNPSEATLEPTPALDAIEARVRAFWDHAGIYRYRAPEDGGEVFSVDTPPAYVSADHLTVGHAMSYSQAEFIVRYQRMRGRTIFYPMGFDDNGMPTERFVERKYGIEGRNVSRSEFRQLCVEETAVVSRLYEELWRALGLSVDWRLRYSTIDERSRRTAQLSFIQAMEQGRIYRSGDPVFWDPAMGTALAQADLELVERDGVLHDIVFRSSRGEALTVATTRPELLPACVALYCHPDDDRYQPLLDGGAHAVTPLFGATVPIRADHEVDRDFGTGLMMVCTFGDAEDVRRWRRDQLDTRLVLDEAGRLTAAAGQYEGLTAEAARKRMVADLHSAGALAGSRRTKQRVSVSERTGAAVELLMRPQWFLRILDLKDEMLKRASELRIHPSWMRPRLEEWIAGLNYDWNLSRQRHFGVPFPVWFCRACGEPTLARESQLPVDPIDGDIPHDPCDKCGGTAFEGDPDVMDTWMTSSVSPLILKNGPTPPPPGPLTMRVQSHDIIRTWLFYTLLKSHMHEGALPWTDVMISGWGLDEQGRRISKRNLDPNRPPGTYSRYDPHDVIVEHGADAIRHWAARAHLGQDVRYNERDVKAGRKVVLKLWNAARFCQPHLPDFGGPVAPVAIEDRWITHQVDTAVDAATRALEQYDYATARQATDDLLWSFTDDWLELAKHRIRTGAWNASAAGTMRNTLRTLIGLYAPFLPFITEELYQQLFRETEGTLSLHVTSWPETTGAWPAPDMSLALAVLGAARSARTARRIPQSQEAVLAIIDADDPSVLDALTSLEPTLLAACRARSLKFAAASGNTALPGLRLDLDFEHQAGEDYAGKV